MSRLRPPVVAGLVRGAGASTLAAALHAVDGGPLAPGAAGEADVLLCPADEPSLRQAATLVCTPARPRPVLVLTGRVRSGAAALVPAARFGGVVVLPHVRRWVGGDGPGEARAVLAFAPEDLPPDVRPYAAALHRLVTTLTGSGLLHGSPPLITRPLASTLWRGLRPVAPATSHRRRGPRPEPDDEALEAEPAPVPAGRTG